MSIRFTGNKTAIRRLSNLPTAHNNFEICFFFKLLNAAAARVATIAYTQTAIGDSAETYVLGGDGTKVRAGDDYGGVFSSDVATVTAGGASGSNWYFGSLVGVGSGAAGLRAYHCTVGGTPTFQSVNNRANASAFSVIQFGDLPYGEAGWFDGLIAHLKVYDRVLSDAERIAEAARGAPGTTTGLISYHSFSNATLATALIPDQGSGTFSGFTSDPTTSTDMPVFVTGPVLSGTDTLPERQGVVPTVVTTALPAGLTGVAYSQTLAATGDLPITWSITSGSLPSGLSLSSSTGVISGTPSSAATSSFTATATNAFGSDGQALQIVTTSPGTSPTILTTELPNGQIGQAYSQILTATGTTPITWTMSSGSPPPGLALVNDDKNKVRNSTMTGAVAGTPGTAPTYWSLTSGSGIAVSVVGTGTEEGLTYMDVRWNGTASASNTLRAYFEASGGVAVSSPVGQVWTASMYVKLVAGSTTDVNQFRMTLEEFNGGTNNGGTTTPFSGVPTNATLLSQRRTTTRTLTNAASTSIRPQFNFTFSSGDVIDMTLRFAAPQLERSATATVYADPLFQYLQGVPTTVGSYSFALAATNSVGSATRTYTVQIAPEVSEPPVQDDGWVRLPRDAEVWVRVPRTPPT